MRDLSTLQVHNQTLNEQLWRNGAAVQHLTLQVNQANANLAQTDKNLHRVRALADQQRIALEDEKEQHRLVRKSLDYEFMKHAETEKDLEHAKNINDSFKTLTDKLDLSDANGDGIVTLPRDTSLGSLLKDNLDMKQDLESTRHQLGEYQRMLEGKNQALRDLEESNRKTAESLEQKNSEILHLKAELYHIGSDEEVETGIALLGKRKRVNNDGR